MDEINPPLPQDKPALAAYNLKDCELVPRIFAKTGTAERSCCERARHRPAGGPERRLGCRVQPSATCRACTG